MFYEKAKELYCKVKKFEKDPKKELYRMPSECYFLSKDEIICYNREIGDGRFPYSFDGLTLWAYSSGNMSLGESNFNVFLESTEGREPYVAFFFGQKDGESFLPVSVTGVARRGGEHGVNRFTVFTASCVYYFAETEKLLAVVRVFVDEKKRIHFSFAVGNKSGEKVETYLSSYFNPLLRHQCYDDFEDKWYKSAEKTEYGYKIRVTEHITRDNCFTHFAFLGVSGDEGGDFTTSRRVFTGATSNSLSNAEPLFSGKFAEKKLYTEFTETAVIGEINRVTLSPDEVKEICYIFCVSDDENEVSKVDLTDLFAESEKELRHLEENNKNVPFNKMNIELKGFTGEFSGKDTVVNDFLYNVMRQVDYCARAKNYAGDFIGVRDVTQQVEAMIPWDYKYAGVKLAEILSFTGDDGRPPRQYSYPQNSSVAPLMDLRAYIDQGLWIISCAYTYLAYSGDYGFLDKVCGYYNFDGLPMTVRSGTAVHFSNRKDTVLEHLIAICDFLISNIDKDTHCLHALYGDWNDALDGLGITEKKDRVFGNGVSVMASLQLYRNLNEMIEILHKVGKFREKAEYYKAKKEELKNGLINNAVVEKDGIKKILHGWGEDRSWFVGSFSDGDGKSRDSVTVNSFWILSGLYKECGEMIPHILAAYDRLKGKYGLKTFDPAFSSDDKLVGRIKNLPEGTAENGATYNHSTLFAIMSLLEIGESKRAWDLLFKVIPVNHRIITTTPFVMSNSFIFNQEKGFDGESMNDWFTGSASVMVKSIIGGVFGIKPSLSYLTVKLSEYLPCEEASIKAFVKYAEIEIRYANKGNRKRRYFIDGREIKAENNEIVIPDEKLKGKIKIEIFD